MTDFNRGMEIYDGSGTLAYLHALDPGLASRLARSGGDPTKLTGEDNQLASQYMLDGGWTPEGLATLGYAPGDQLSDFWKRMAAFRDVGEDRLAPEAPVRQRPDPVAVREQIRTIWKGLFRTDPSEDVMAAFEMELNNVLDTAPLEQTIDITARIQQFAERSEMFDDLYGAADGRDPMDYQSQFVAASQSMLGGELADEDAITAGMRSGEYQTTIGAVAGSDEAWGNSAFLGRLARAGQIINENT